MTDDEVLDALRARIASGMATDNGRTVPPEPAPASALARAEEVIGFPIPSLLRRIYAEVANGGVGPFDGIDGVDGGHGTYASMLSTYTDYLAMESAPGLPPPPPLGVVFLCDFGCAMWALIDFRHPRGQMWWWEEGDRYKQDLTFDTWIRSWLEGSLPAVPQFREAALEEESWRAPDDD